MPKEVQHKPEPLSEKYKVLIFSIFTLISLIFALNSGYAMIYRITASIVSYISVTGVIAWFGYHLLFHRHDSYSTAPLLLFLGLYTLHRWYLAALIILLAISSNRLNFKFKGDSLLSKASSIQAEVVLVGVYFFFTDLIREYSVWHRVELRLMPCIALFLSITTCIFIYRKQRLS